MSEANSSRAVPSTPSTHDLAPLPALGGGWIEAPPHVEALVGYDGGRRFVSFHLRLDGRPVVGDGIVERVGQYGPFVAWTQHPYVWPSLTSDGSRDDREPHIVLDRLSRRVYAARGTAARRFLADASGEQGGGNRVSRYVSLDELESDGRCLDPDPFARAEFERGAIPRMEEWLGSRSLPCSSCRTGHVASDYKSGVDGHPVCPSCGVAFYGPPLFDRLAQLRAVSKS